MIYSTMFGTVTEMVATRPPRRSIRANGCVAYVDDTAVIGAKCIASDIGALGGNEVWLAVANCVSGAFTGLSGCVPHTITDVAANAEVVYVVAGGNVYGFSHTERGNRLLARALSGSGVRTRHKHRPPRDPAENAITDARLAFQPVEGDHTVWVHANATHVARGLSSGIVHVMPTLPVAGDRAFAHWSPRLCDPETTKSACFFNERGEHCQLREREPVRDAPSKQRWEHAMHEDCTGVAVMRDGKVVGCVDRPTCERYNVKANACEHVSRPRTRRQAYTDDPCVTPPGITETPTQPPHEHKVVCGEFEFVDRGECIECARCGAGMRLDRWCTATEDTVCADCPPHTFQPKLVHNETSCRPSNGCGGGNRVSDGDCKGDAIPWQHGIWIAAAAYALLVGGGNSNI